MFSHLSKIYLLTCLLQKCFCLNCENFVIYKTNFWAKPAGTPKTIEQCNQDERCATSHYRNVHQGKVIEVFNGGCINEKSCVSKKCDLYEAVFGDLTSLLGYSNVSVTCHINCKPVAHQIPENTEDFKTEEKPVSCLTYYKYEEDLEQMPNMDSKISTLCPIGHVCGKRIVSYKYFDRPATKSTSSGCVLADLCWGKGKADYCNRTSTFHHKVLSAEMTYPENLKITCDIDCSKAQRTTLEFSTTLFCAILTIHFYFMALYLEL